MIAEAYASLANAEQVLVLIMDGLPCHTQAVTVGMEELKSVLQNVRSARDNIRLYSLTTGS